MWLAAGKLCWAGCTRAAAGSCFSAACQGFPTAARHSLPERQGVVPGVALCETSFACRKSGCADTTGWLGSRKGRKARRNCGIEFSGPDPAVQVTCVACCRKAELGGLHASGGGLFSRAVCQGFPTAARHSLPERQAVVPGAASWLCVRLCPCEPVCDFVHRPIFRRQAARGVVCRGVARAMDSSPILSTIGAEYSDPVPAN